jgi:hypothetical protein
VVAASSLSRCGVSCQLPPRSKFSWWSLSFWISHQDPIRVPLLSHVTCPAHFIFTNLIYSTRGMRIILERWQPLGLSAHCSLSHGLEGSPPCALDVVIGAGSIHTLTPYLFKIVLDSILLRTTSSHDYTGRYITWLACCVPLMLFFRIFEALKHVLKLNICTKILCLEPVPNTYTNCVNSDPRNSILRYHKWHLSSKSLVSRRETK